MDFVSETGLHLEVLKTPNGVELHQTFAGFEVPVMTTFLDDQHGLLVVKILQAALICVLDELRTVPLVGAEASVGLVRSQGLFILLWEPTRRPLNLNRAFIPGRDNETIRSAVLCLSRIRYAFASPLTPVRSLMQN